MALAIVFCAVMTMKSVSRPSSRARERTSSPDTSGMRMSTRARSKGRERRAASASAPLGAATTVWPLWAQARSRTQRMDSSSSATRMVPDRLGSGLDMLLTHGKGDDETRAPPGTGLVGDDAAVLGDDAVAHRETEPGAARLCGEERGEEAVLDVLGHTGTVVRDRDRKKLVAMRATSDVVAGLDARRDGELAVSTEGFDGVPHEVEKHLRQLRAIAQDFGQARVELGPKHDLPPVGCLALEREDVVQNAMDVLRRELEAGRGAEAAELLDAAVQPVDLADDHVGGLDLGRVAQVRAQELGGALDATERVADLVREAEGDGAQRRQVVGAPGGRVERALQGEIVQHQDGAAQLALLVVHRRARSAHRDPGPPRAQPDLAAPACQAALEGRERQLRQPGVRGSAAEELLDGTADRLGCCDADEVLGGRVECAQDAGSVECDHAVRDAGQDVGPAQALGNP